MNKQKKEKQSIVFILNPISGTGKQKHIQSLIQQHLDLNKFDFEIFETEYAGHARELSRKNVADGKQIIIAIGGDGTINESFQPIVGSKSTFGIIPCGSGNGLARHLNIPMDLKLAIQLINKLNTKTIDTATINDHAFVNIAGVGYDAYVAKKFDEGKFRGLFSYLGIILRNYIGYKEKKYLIRTEDQEYSQFAFAISFANSDQFGNNAFIAPQAIIDDGMLEICVVKKIPFYKLSYFTILVLRRKIQQSKYYRSFKASNLTIKSDQNLLVNIDGEAVEMGKEIELKTFPKSLNIIVP